MSWSNELVCQKANGQGSGHGGQEDDQEGSSSELIDGCKPSVVMVSSLA